MKITIKRIRENIFTQHVKSLFRKRKKNNRNQGMHMKSLLKTNENHYQKMGGNIIMTHVKSQSKTGTIVIKECI